MRCPSCKQEIEGQAKFCPECGEQLPQVVKCASCSSELPGTAKFCPECGAKIVTGKAKDDKDNQRSESKIQISPEEFGIKLFLHLEPVYYDGVLQPFRLAEQAKSPVEKMDILLPTVLSDRLDRCLYEMSSGLAKLLEGFLPNETSIDAKPLYDDMVSITGRLKVLFDSLNKIATQFEGAKNSSSTGSGAIVGSVIGGSTRLGGLGSLAGAVLGSLKEMADKQSKIHPIAEKYIEEAKNLRFEFRNLWPRIFDRMAVFAGKSLGVKVPGATETKKRVTEYRCLIAKARTGLREEIPSQETIDDGLRAVWISSGHPDALVVAGMGKFRLSASEGISLEERKNLVLEAETMSENATQTNPDHSEGLFLRLQCAMLKNQWEDQASSGIEQGLLDRLFVNCDDPILLMAAREFLLQVYMDSDDSDDDTDSLSLLEEANRFRDKSLALVPIVHGMCLDTVISRIQEYLKEATAGKTPKTVTGIQKKKSIFMKVAQQVKPIIDLRWTLDEKALGNFLSGSGGLKKDESFLYGMNQSLPLFAAYKAFFAMTTHRLLCKEHGTECVSIPISIIDSLDGKFVMQAFLIVEGKDRSQGEIKSARAVGHVQHFANIFNAIVKPAIGKWVE